MTTAHDKLVMTIYPNNIAKITSTFRGISAVKHCTMGDIRNLFTVDEYISPVLNVWVAKLKISANYKEYLICKAMPGEMFNMFFTSRGSQVVTQRNLHYPYLYWYVRLTEHTQGILQMDNSKHFTSFQPPSETTELYTPYFGNIYEGGDICWGGLRAAIYSGFSSQGIRFLSSVPDTHLAAIHNQDLTNDDSNCSRSSEVRYTNYDNWKNSELLYRGSRLINTIFTS